jgi:histidinol-phosphatase (PHP family)
MKWWKRMEKVSYHTHSTVSDGKVEPEKLIKEAIEKEFKVLAFTDHYRCPPGFKDWSDKFYSEEDYELLIRLKIKYKDKIEILVGAEFDWIPHYGDWILKETKKRDYDLKLISIHFLKIGEEGYPIDCSEGLFLETANKVGGVKELVKIYYKTLRKGINTGMFDVASHIDLIKIWNKDSKFFNEEDSWYQKEIKELLDDIKKYGMKIDFNLKGLKKPCGQPYPSKWILEEARKMGIKILIGTDAHHLEELDYDINKVRKLLR